MVSSYDAMPDGFVLIPGYKYYCIDASGEVLVYNRSWNTAKQRRRSGKGCAQVSLQNADTGQYTEHRVCTLSLLTFRDEPLRKGGRVIHRDGDPDNNHPDNLEYAVTATQTRTEAQFLADLKDKHRAIRDRYTAEQLVDAYTKLVGHELSWGLVSKLTGIKEDHLITLFWVD